MSDNFCGKFHMDDHHHNVHACRPTCCRVYIRRMHVRRPTVFCGFAYIFHSLHITYYRRQCQSLTDASTYFIRTGYRQTDKCVHRFWKRAESAYSWIGIITTQIGRRISERTRLESNVSNQCQWNMRQNIVQHATAACVKVICVITCFHRTRLSHVVLCFSRMFYYVVLLCFNCMLYYYVLVACCPANHYKLRDRNTSSFWTRPQAMHRQLAPLFDKPAFLQNSPKFWTTVRHRQLAPFLERIS
jgi:hypothetical protein